MGLLICFSMFPFLTRSMVMTPSAGSDDTESVLMAPMLLGMRGGLVMVVLLVMLMGAMMVIMASTLHGFHHFRPTGSAVS